ncbi:hypothetical protein DMN91_009024 [Ooceraea biroi]|uniref:Uncharacterized protein n=1 Tax=Ooceraea biroi TaxID=2015173 RepID=A0A3L8DDX6_OOCBI|nr:uncharacterized protein LOC105276282 [Ooceraea biroi]XP_011332091.1 uncharacterized protein LOC105276282 [Ooceraea biroi]RLU18667.1 hypothetical protein DMN91_009024 [Ooceraea biroi]
METTEETITRQRKKELQNDMEDKLSDNIEENEKKEESKKEVKAGFKYYYNKFRYYHYYIAKKIDNGIGVLCMWIFKLLLYLMGYRYNELPFIPDDECIRPYCHCRNSNIHEPIVKDAVQSPRGTIRNGSLFEKFLSTLLSDRSCFARSLIRTF